MVKLIEPSQNAAPKDALEKFHGNMVVYVDWDYHRFLCSALAFPFPPNMPFGALIKDVLPAMYGAHPDFDQIEWSKVSWSLDGDENFAPDPQKSLEELGVKHKSLLQFSTPGLDGIGGSSN